MASYTGNDHKKINNVANAPRTVLPVDGLERLLKSLSQEGYELVGPAVQKGAIVYQTITGVEDLPRGWQDDQQPGRYQLWRRQDDALFGFAVGPHSWKRFLHPPSEVLLRVRKNGADLISAPEPLPTEKYAFIGVRACEIQAIAVQDRVFLGGGYVDERYAARRANLFIVAVNCAEAGGTCFCVSMHSGPKVSSGFDLALTELVSEGAHEFVVEVGSERGAKVLGQIPHAAATPSQEAAADKVVAQTARQMGRKLDTQDIKAILQANPEHPRWEQVAERCLSCGNCTMVCPTCFCTSIEDRSDLSGSRAERIRQWDSCFTMDFSYIHGGSVRKAGRSRYRHWITHKLASWYDQFGTSGCIGCGRCITWCPVGIDITEEAAAVRPPLNSGEAEQDG